MKQQRGQSGGRAQSALLTAVLVLVAADVFVRLEPPAANAAVQPESRTPDQPSAPSLINPARQRAMIVDELKDLNRRVTGMEQKLDGRLRVEVVNFPKVESSRGE